MSYVERMDRLSRYRELRRNRPRRNGARIISTPHVPRTAEQRQRLANLANELSQYEMKSDHTLCEHIRIVNQMIEAVIRCGRIMSKLDKVHALSLTLPNDTAHKFTMIWAANTELPYDDLVYLLLEDDVNHNLNRTCKLANSSNFRLSKGPSINYPWMKNMTTVIMDREKIEESMPRAVRFR